MIRKSLLLLPVLALCCRELYAQEFMQSVGATISVLYGRINDPDESYNLGLAQTTFTYFPRYNFAENENSSVSIGVPLGAGIGIAKSTYYGDDAGIAFAFDLPVVLDYNIGCKSTRDNDRSFGGYFGLGAGYFREIITGSQYSDFNGATFGPIVRGGIRIGPPSWNGYGMTVGLYYKRGIDKHKLKTIGCNILIDL